MSHTSLSHTLALKGLHSHRCETALVCRSKACQCVLIGCVAKWSQNIKHLHTVTHAHPHFLSAFEHNFLPVQLMGNGAAELKPLSTSMFFSWEHFFSGDHMGGLRGVVHSWNTAGLSPAWDRRTQRKNSLCWEDLETSVKQTHRWVRGESSFTSPAAGYGW